MSWKVVFSGGTIKEKKFLPDKVRTALGFLLMEIESMGPVRGNWKNYGKLGKDTHHCHLKLGRPTYVACWRVNKDIKLVEVYYVGTHEKAPY